jgi:hypothetical protein
MKSPSPFAHKYGYDKLRIARNLTFCESLSRHLNFHFDRTLLAICHLLMSYADLQKHTTGRSNLKLSAIVLQKRALLCEVWAFAFLCSATHARRIRTVRACTFAIELDCSVIIRTREPTHFLDNQTYRGPNAPLKSQNVYILSLI